MDRLEKQLQFIVEIDKLKSIYRRTYLIHGTRNDNTAEHSWHLAILAMVLADYANVQVSMDRVVRLVRVPVLADADAADAEDDLLLNARVVVAAVQLCRDGAILGTVRRDVRVE